MANLLPTKYNVQSCSKNCKSNNRVQKQPADPYFENAVTKFEERQGGLIMRQRHLKDKVATMEKSIPALMAYNMWMAGQNCEDAPLCKIKEIMNKFTMGPDPADRLVEELKGTVKSLNKETTELHDKIIDADVQLEETGMQLESIELANKELQGKLEKLEEEAQSCAVPRVQSIHSEDLLCLSRIRKLGEEAVNLKCGIKEMEEKEALFRAQMDRLLTAREFQKASGGKKMVKRIQELELNERKMNCALQTHKYNMHHLKKKLMQKEKELARLDVSLQAPGPAVKSKESSERNGKSSQSEGKRKSWLPGWMQSSAASSPATQLEAKEAKKRRPQSRSYTAAEDDSSLKTCVCPTPAPVPCYEKPPCRPASLPLPNCITHNEPSTHKAPRCFKPSPCKPCPVPSTYTNTTQCPPQSCCVPLRAKSHSASAPKSCCCSSMSRRSQLPFKEQSHLSKSTSCRDNPLCESPPCAKTYSDCPSNSGKKLTTTHRPHRGRCSPPQSCIPAPCDVGSSCETCQSPTPCKECLPMARSGGCRCSCKGKCARGESGVPCNCSVEPTCAADMGYQPKGLPKPPCGKDSSCWLEEDSSDEFCDCCDCGCNDSDESDDPPCKDG